MTEDVIRAEFEPPLMLTAALTHYMHMRSELTEFVRSYHAIANRAVLRDDGEEDEVIFKTYRGNAVFFLEHFLVRASDLFDVYIEELIFVVANGVPDFSKPEISSARQPNLIDWEFKKTRLRSICKPRQI